MLRLSDVHAQYGPIVALRNISMEVPEGGVVAVLGANGAGKTTTLRTISGMIRPSGGTIEFMGKRIDRTAPEKIVQMGISQVPEGRGTFTELTVLENLKLGAYVRKDRGAIKQDIDRVFGYFPRLKERQSQHAGTLSGGEQQMLAIGRALMARPKLLLLDEPSMGISPILTERIYETIAEINKQGTTILLVEQNANFALGVSHRGYVLETGKVVLSDESSKLRESPEVKEAYLGG